MKDFFRTIDLVGFTPKIFFQEKNKYKTILGGIMTMFITLLTILATISFGKDLYNRTNPNILFNKNFIDPAFNLTGETIIGYRLFYTGGVQIEDLDRLVDVFLVHSIFDPKLAKSIVTRYDMIKCSQADVYKKNYLNLTTLIGNPHDYFCLPNNASFLLKGKYGAPINNHMHLRIGICKNTTANGDRCYADDVIRKKMSSFFVSFIYKDSFIDGKDFENPVKYYITSNTLKSSSYTFRQDAYLFKDVTFKTDEGLILPQEKEQDYFQLDTISSGSTAESNTEIFTNVIVGMTNLKDFYSRKYIKIQDVSAQVGGIIKFFLIFTEFFITFYSYVPFLETLYDSLFDYGNVIRKEKNTKISNRIALENSEANLVLHNHALNKNSAPKLMNAEKPKGIINDIIYFKNLKNKITPQSYSCLEIFLRCLKRKKKYQYLEKISANYTKIFDVERIFINEYKISNLFEYSFNKVEQEIIKVHSVIKFFETEIINMQDNKEIDKDWTILNSKIFKRLNIPKSLVNERMLDNSKNDHEGYLNLQPKKN